jgi:DNA-binding IclR family transcriptional regulator
MLHNDENQEAEGRYIVGSVDNALSILNLFFDYEELSASEIGKLTNMSRSTAFRFMVTLENRGYVTKTPYGKYRLGLNLFSLGMLAYNRMELVSIAHPVLVETAAAAGETCHIAILDGGVRVIFIDRALSSSRLKMDTALGYSQYAHCTSTGKAILAFQPPQVINQYIRNTSFVQNTPSSIKDAQTLLQVLEQVRLDGYATDNEESEFGLTCYAKPLLDSSGRPYAAISISGPTTRMEMKKEEHLQQLSMAVNKITRGIG